MKHFLIILIFIFPSLSHAIEKEWRVHGEWQSYKVLGTACKDKIVNVKYGFHPDGKYTISAQMNRLGGENKESAQGVYKIEGNTITAQVNDHAIGPFHIRFEKDDLVIQQTNPLCTIFLKQIDEY